MSPPKTKKRRTLVEPEEENDDKEYEVQGIVGIRELPNGKVFYKIRWLGYSREEDTWEDKTRLNCQDLIKEFHKKSAKAFKKKDIEKILKMRIQGKDLPQFLIHWTGKPSTDDSWEDEAKFMNCPDLIDDFFIESKKVKAPKKSGPTIKGKRGTRR